MFQLSGFYCKSLEKLSSPAGPCTPSFSTTSVQPMQANVFHLTRKSFDHDSSHIHHICTLGAIV